MARGYTISAARAHPVSVTWPPAGLGKPVTHRVARLTSQGDVTRIAAMPGSASPLRDSLTTLDFISALCREGGYRRPAAWKLRSLSSDAATLEKHLPRYPR